MATFIESESAVEVTVVLSTFNGQAYLTEAIQSVLGQTLRSIEFLVMDDGSSDDTLRILKEISREDPRLVVYENTQNRGTGYCYTRLLGLAKGRYIASIGQDDIWLPRFLETSVARLHANPRSVVSFTQVQVIGPAGEERPKADAPFLFDLAKTLSRDDLIFLLFRHNLLCSVSAVFDSSHLLGWRNLGDNDQLQDWETWLHLIFLGDFLFIEEPLIKYRVHGNNLSMGAHSPMLAAAEMFHTRLATLSGQSFVHYVLAHPAPNAFLNQIFNVISETMNPDSEGHYYLLLYTLKKIDRELSHLPAFRNMMGMLYLYHGAIHKASRYFTTPALPEISQTRFRSGFQWKQIMCFGSSRFVQVKFPGLVFFQFGPIALIQVLTKRTLINNFSIRRVTGLNRPDRLAERVFSARQISARQKWVGLLESLGFRPVINRLKAVKRRFA